MKLKNAKEFLPFVKAAAEGKTLQWNRMPGRGIWVDCNSEISGYFMDYDEPSHYRIKPESKYRAWQHHEVPLGAWLRSKSCPAVRSLVVRVQEAGVLFPVDVHTGVSFVQTFHTLLTDWECSIDGGKTYLPCGILETE